MVPGSLEVSSSASAALTVCSWDWGSLSCRILHSWWTVRRLASAWSAIHIGHFSWVAAFATGCFPLPPFLSADLVLLDPHFETGLSPRPSSILRFSTSVLSTSSRVIGSLAATFASSCRYKSLASCWSWVSTCRSIISQMSSSDFLLTTSWRRPNSWITLL